MGPWSKFLQLSSKKSIMTSIENEYFIIIIVIIIIIIVFFFWPFYFHHSQKWIDLFFKQ